MHKGKLKLAAIRDFYITITYGWWCWYLCRFWKLKYDNKNSNLLNNIYLSYSTQKHIKCTWKTGWWRRRCTSHIFLKFSLLVHVNKTRNDRLNFYVYRIQMINFSVLVRHRVVYTLLQLLVVTIVWEREEEEKKSSCSRFFWSSTWHVFFHLINLTSYYDLYPFFWLSFTNIKSHTDIFFRIPEEKNYTSSIHTLSHLLIKEKKSCLTHK